MMAGPFGERGVVGEVIEFLFGRAPMRIDDQLEAERLRRLHHAQEAAIERLGHDRIAVDLFHRVGNRDRGDGGAIVFAGRDRARDQRSRQKRPRRVMDEHQIGRCRRRQRLEPRMHRRLPCRAAGDGGHWANSFGAKCFGLEPFCRTAVKIVIIGMNDRLHGADLRMAEKGGERRTNHRLSGYVPVLLGNFTTGALAPASGDNHSRDLARHECISLAIPGSL